MKNIFRRLLKHSNVEPFTHNKGFSSVPISPWKKNAFAAFAGTGVGLYIGQYFPDVFWPEVEPYIPEIEVLKTVAP